MDSPLDDKLVTLLCQAAKSTFKPPQDECHIQLTVGSESQAVAVEGITIQSELAAWGGLCGMGVGQRVMARELWGRISTAVPSAP